MATLYYSHEQAEEIPDTCGVSGNLWSFQIPTKYPVDVWQYLCVVHEGKVYAGRKIHTPNSTLFNVLQCVDFTDSVTGKQILLKHFLLGK